MKSVTSIGYYIFLCLVGLVVLFLVVTLFPIPGNFEVKIVQSGSMEPAIQTGSLVVVKPSDVYTVGDVITFGKDTKENTPTSHRIVEMRVMNGEYFYKTKGDANEDPDPREVRQDAVIGKVVFSLPYAGYLVDFARKPIGFALLVGVPAGVIILDEVGKIWSEARRLRKKKE